jgi:serine/threonine protein kinase
MAPEIIVGEPYSFAADVFSYGIVLIEIITRKKITEEIQRKYGRPCTIRSCHTPHRTHTRTRTRTRVYGLHSPVINHPRRPEEAFGLDVQGFLSIIPTDTPPEFKDAVIGTTLNNSIIQKQNIHIILIIYVMYVITLAC